MYKVDDLKDKINTEGFSNEDRQYLEKVLVKILQRQDKIEKNLEGKLVKSLSFYSQNNQNWIVKTALVDVDQNGDVIDDNGKRLASNYYCDVLRVDIFHERMTLKKGMSDELQEELEHLQMAQVPYCDNGYRYCGIGFLNCEFEKIEKICSVDYDAVLTLKSGDERRVKYVLQPYTGFISTKESWARKTAYQNGIKKPYNYAPWLRRAVMVKLVVDSGDAVDFEGLNCDFRLNGNGLSDILLDGKKVIWNIDSKKFCEDPYRFEKYTVPKESSHFSPKFHNDVGYVMTLPCGDNEYWFIADNAEKVIERDDMNVEIYREENNIYVNVSEEGKLPNFWFSKLAFIKDWPSSQENRFKEFANDVCSGYVTVERIRTMADVDQVVKSIIPKGLVYCGASLIQKSNEKKVTSYGKEEYWYPSDTRMWKSSRPIYLKFAKNGRTGIFFVDAVNYVIGYLRYMYPEFCWYGVY